MDDVKPISYSDCADVIRKMWTEGILTNDEYSRIVYKLNEAQRKIIDNLIDNLMQGAR